MADPNHLTAEEQQRARALWNLICSFEAQLAARDQQIARLTEENAKKAALIELALSVSSSGVWPSEESITPEAERYVDEIKRRYSAYKAHLDFATSARKARSEVIEMILLPALSEPTKEGE